MHGLLKWFLKSAGVVLIITGTAKSVAVFGSAPGLDMPDPVFGISFRTLGFGVGAVEIIVSLFCFRKLRIDLSLRLVAWIASLIALYRLLLASSGWAVPCLCLGSLTGAVGLSFKTANLITGSLLTYLLVGSYSFVAFQWAKEPERFRPREQQRSNASDHGASR